MAAGDLNRPTTAVANGGEGEEDVDPEYPPVIQCPGENARAGKDWRTGPLDSAGHHRARGNMRLSWAKME